MTKEKVGNQCVDENQDLQDCEGRSSCEGTSCDNMSGDESVSADTMSEDDKANNPAGEAEVADGFVEPTSEEVIAIWRDKYMRLQAEFDNYRKRTLREKMDLVASGGADVIKSMLLVLDDMYRAVAASEKSDDINSLREGEKLVLHKFEEALRQKNVVEIEAVDQEFNPDFHEAVARFAAGEDKKGKIIDVVQRGFMLGDKVLRYAKVVVGE